MTGPGPERRRREQVAVRISQNGLDAVDEYAEREQRSRSDMIRILLAEAIAARRKREGRTR